MTGKEIQIFSKVILCGEHSVLRGGLALVAPLKTHQLKAQLIEADTFSFEFDEEVKPYEMLFQGSLEKALELLEKTREDLKMKIQVQSLVPLGKGLGGSAALSVFIARLMSAQGFIEEKEIFSFAVELENMFHGESSGLDVAGCLSDELKTYTRGKKPEPVNNKLEGHFFSLTEVDERGDTQTCIEKVLSLKAQNKSLFHDLDNEMDQATRETMEGLESNAPLKIQEGMERAKKTFQSWGLVTDSMERVMKDLQERGALASKPTGSGLGGHILSFWKDSHKERFQNSGGQPLDLGL